jgi:hypothetical protein
LSWAAASFPVAGWSCTPESWLCCWRTRVGPCPIRRGGISAAPESSLACPCVRAAAERWPSKSWSRPVLPIANHAQAAAAVLAASQEAQVEVAWRRRGWRSRSMTSHIKMRTHTPPPPRHLDGYCPEPSRATPPMDTPSPSDAPCLAAPCAAPCPAVPYGCAAPCRSLLLHCDAVLVSDA